MSRKHSRRTTHGNSPGAAPAGNPARRWQRAVTAYQRGDAAEARRALKPLLEHPSADGHTFLLGGMVEAQLANWPRAESFLVKAVETIPERLEGWLTLGNVLHARGRMEEASNAYQEASTRAPGNVQVWNNLGVVNEDMGRIRDALDYYERALEIEPDFAQSLRGRAGVLGHLRWFEEAKRAYEQLFGRFPDDKVLQIEYAELLEQANRPKAAAMYLPGPGVLRDTLADARAEYLRAQLSIREGKLSSGLEGLRRARQRTGQDFLCYREGTILDRLGRYPEAMTAFARGNDSRSKQKNFQRLLAQPVAEYLDHKLDKGVELSATPDGENASDEILPVFITGLPRSGTTLLDRMLNAHPEIQVLEELEGLRMAEAALAENATPVEARRLYWDFIRRHVQPRPGATIIDKNPLHVMHLDVLSKLFPEASVIFVLRHPYDAALSCFMQDFSPGPVTARFLELGSTAAICARFVKLMRQYEAACPQRTMRVHYENLVTRFQEEVKRILGKIGLDWHEAIEDYANIAAGSAPIMTASYEQVTRKLYKTSVERWKYYEPWLGPFHNALGEVLGDFDYGRGIDIDPGSG
ncbi:MAG: Beta-barrel assembly-enhancing protease [Gammaproteobacteria bacterium]|nr:Beta-barrel assembly-enhancing protease [Gammaproteobacteria bacterium]